MQIYLRQGCPHPLQTGERWLHCPAQQRCPCPPAWAVELWLQPHLRGRGSLPGSGTAGLQLQQPPRLAVGAVPGGLGCLHWLCHSWVTHTFAAASALSQPLQNRGTLQWIQAAWEVLPCCKLYAACSCDGREALEQVISVFGGLFKTLWQ